MRKVPFRQIHLDFHTSPDIPDIASDFNGKEFARTLKAAHVESINLFAKCHHGMYYYPTQLGRVHPNLKVDLLKEQLAACQDEGIKTLIYTCVGWSEDTAHNHPDWQEVNIEGVLGNRKPFDRPYYSWQKLCLNNPHYRDYLKQEFMEIFKFFKPYGYWIDIVFQNQCICQHCQKDMLKSGLNPENLIDRYKHDRMVQIDFMQEMYRYIKGLDSAHHIYFNSHPYEMDLGDDEKYATENKRICNTFIDVESLPSEMWGYAHFPIAINYINKYDVDITMMNGKFHTAWGDFGSLRNKKALEYECFRALSNGAGVCVGDQLHPCGKLDVMTYKLVGEVFTMIEAKEKWCRETRKIAQIGVFNTRRSGIMSPNDHNVDMPVEGAYRILTELHYSFDILNLKDDFDKYDLLILPDNVYLNAQAVSKIETFIQKGGKLLATCKSALNQDRNEFLLDCLGISYLSEAEYNPRYMKIEKTMFPNIDEMVYVTYEKGVNVKTRPGTEILAPVVNPYFNRGEYQFCSHRHTPPTHEVSSFPAITKNDSTIYVANPIFTDYAKNRCKVYKEIVANLIEQLGIEPQVKANIPSFVEITTRSKDQYFIVHILNYIIEHKSRTIDTIEEMVPLFNRHMSVKLPERPVRIFIFDSDQQIENDLDYSWDGERALFELQEIDGHTMVIIEQSNHHE